MKKSLFLFLLIMSIISFAQEEDGETGSEGVDSSPVEIGEPPSEGMEPIPPPEEVSPPADVAPEESEYGDSVDVQTTPDSEQSMEQLHTAEVKSQDAAMSEASMPTLSTQAPIDEKFLNPRKSHWLMSMGFEGMEYRVPYEFNGIRQDYSGKTVIKMYGGRLGFGREFFLEEDL